MASMEEINGQLNAAKAGFEVGKQITLEGESRADMLEMRLGSMWGTVHELQTIGLSTIMEDLVTSVADARSANGEAMGTLRRTFQGEDEQDLDPDMQKTMEYGDAACSYLKEGETVDLKGPIGLEEMQQRTQKIGEHLAALFEELRLARNQSRLLSMHLERSTHRSVAASDGISDYQRKRGLPGHGWK